MNSENNENCLICLEKLQNYEMIKKEFFCKCKHLLVHILCYNRYYNENYYKCFICHEYNTDEIYKIMYNDFKNAIKILNNISKFNCICRLNDMHINDKFLIKSFEFNQKIILLYHPIMMMKRNTKFIEELNKKINYEIIKHKNKNKTLFEMNKFFMMINNFEIREI